MFSITKSIEAMKLSFKKKIIIGINIIGVICLGYYALPYLMHDTTIGNSEAMLPMREYEASGFVLTLGLLPLVLANLLAFLLIKCQNKWVRLLWFLPSLVCFLIVAHFWITEIGDALQKL